VVPVFEGIQTSLVIIDEGGQLFMLNLVERSLVPGQSTVAKVRLLAAESLFANRNRELLEQSGRDVAPSGADRKGAGLTGEPPASQVGRISANRYRVAGNPFRIEKVFDNGIFTYIVLPSSQNRPAMFLNSGKELEPVRYIDKGSYYLVHRVLTGKKECFRLVLGRDESEIWIHDTKKGGIP
jgi:hypothetical protein